MVDELNTLLDKRGSRFLYAGQLRDAARSMPDNIREGYGRRKGPDRMRFLIMARGSAEEADEQLRANFAANRLPAVVYWRLHHRFSVIVKMLTSLIDRDDPD